MQSAYFMNTRTQQANIPGLLPSIERMCFSNETLLLEIKG